MADDNVRTVFVQPTTGGRIPVSVPVQSSINSLKVVLGKRLKVPTEKIVLLHKNRQLTEGTLSENNIPDGAKLTLLPTVETGIMTPNTEQCVIQALEALNESQVEDFLAGRSPLNLSMRLGEQMIFVRLQLSGTPPPPDPANTTQLPPTPPPSPPALRQATRSLAHTLRHLSTTTLRQKMNEDCNGRCCIARQQGGAVIESMFHHGRGVFSGTFTGTLSPLLQDKEGRPRRHVFTILHILNDLLGASSHCNSPPCSPTTVTAPCPTVITPTSSPAPQSSLRPEPDENQTLREKVQRIRTLLSKRRHERRHAPYPSPSVQTTPPNATDYSPSTAVA